MTHKHYPETTAEKLEDTLNGGYGGLYGEVVTCDSYELQTVDFQPDVVFDIGANVGVFTRYARTLFPESLIVSVEPDPENYGNLTKFTDDDNAILLNMALGAGGQIFHATTAVNGSGEVYLSAGLGFPEEAMTKAAAAGDTMEFSDVESAQLSDIISPHWVEGGKHLLKVDCEGAENNIWTHKPSLDILKSIDYIAMEVHFYSHTGAEQELVNTKTINALKSLESTHECRLEGVHFWATKRKL